MSVPVGIVGAGIWGSNHALALTTHPAAHVVVICDRDEARARRAGERFGCAWTTSLDDLAKSDVQAVTIATPDHLHREPALAMREPSASSAPVPAAPRQQAIVR